MLIGGHILVAGVWMFMLQQPLNLYSINIVHAITSCFLTYHIRQVISMNWKLVPIWIKQYFAIGTRQVLTYLLRTMKCKIKIMYHITHLGRCWSGAASCFRTFFPPTSTTWAVLKWRMQTRGFCMFGILPAVLQPLPPPWPIKCVSRDSFQTWFAVAVPNTAALWHGWS